MKRKISEFIENLKSFPQDAYIEIWSGIEFRDPGGTFDIKELFYDKTRNSVQIRFEED